MTLEVLENALADGNVQAFLRVIRQRESGQGDDAYSIINGGAHFEDFSKHPYEGQRAPPGRAAGAYQYIPSTWAAVAKKCGFSDFSPANQDLGAVELIRGRGALDDVLQGRIEQAIIKCRQEWTSLPGASENTGYTMAQALEVFSKYGGLMSTETPPKDAAMVPLVPIFAALLPTLAELIPKVKLLFPGSEVSERNVKAVSLAFEVAQKAIGASNALELVQTLQTDSAKVPVASKAIEENWWQLTEAGGGGIEGARKADAEFVASKAHVWDSPSFWAMCLCLPLIYFVMGAVIGVWGKMTLSGEVTASIITGVITLVVGGISGYFWGSTTSRNKPQGT